MSDLSLFMTKILNLNNSPFYPWVIIIFVSLILTFVLKITIKFLSKSLRKMALKTETIWDDIAVDLLDRLNIFVVFFLILFLLSKSINPSPYFAKFLAVTYVTLISMQVILWGLHLIKNCKNIIIKKKIRNDPSSVSTISFLYRVFQSIFILVIVLIALSNLNIDIGALLAGLGIGGIAVALAAQNILGDLLAALSIILDKPFRVGDFIVAGNEKGVVENIGIKTTRIRSLSGEEIVISNKNLLDSRVQNYKRMWQRRIVQKFGVIYSTPADILEQIPLWVKDFIEKEKKLTFDRCHFAGFGTSSLDFEFVFYVTDSDYNVFMDLQQKVLLNIFKKFAEEGVDFAFPTQTIYLNKSGSAQ